MKKRKQPIENSCFVFTYIQHAPAAQTPFEFACWSLFSSWNIRSRRGSITSLTAHHLSSIHQFLHPNLSCIYIMYYTQKWNVNNIVISLYIKACVFVAFSQLTLMYSIVAHRKTRSNRFVCLFVCFFAFFFFYLVRAFVIRWHRFYVN